MLPEAFCSLSAVPMYVLSLILKPVNIVVTSFVNLVSKIWASKTDDSEAISEDDFENIIDIVEDEGVLDEEQCDLLQNALDFDYSANGLIIPSKEQIDFVRADFEKDVRRIFENKVTIFSEEQMEELKKLNFIIRKGNL